MTAKQQRIFLIFFSFFLHFFVCPAQRFDVGLDNETSSGFLTRKSSYFSFSRSNLSIYCRYNVENDVIFRVGRWHQAAIGGLARYGIPTLNHETRRVKRWQNVEIKLCEMGWAKHQRGSKQFFFNFIRSLVGEHDVVDTHPTTSPSPKALIDIHSVWFNENLISENFLRTSSKRSSTTTSTTLTLSAKSTKYQIF